jgi:hypothetical protein
MNSEQQQQLHATLQALQQQVAALQQANTVLQHQKELQRNGLDLCDEVKELFVAHLQFKQMDAAERKRTLNAYPKSGDLPSALTDSNGLAAKAVGDGQARKLVLTQLPALQRESLDALRVAATGLHMGLQMQNAPPEQRVAHLQSVLADVVKIICDNAQRVAKTQLEAVFDAAKAKGAYALLQIDPTEESCDIDEKNDNILQSAHVDAMAEIKKYNRSVETTKPKFPGRGRGGGRGGNGSGWRGRGGRGGNNWRGGRGNFRGGNYNNNNHGGGGNDGGSTPNGNSGS